MQEHTLHNISIYIKGSIYRGGRNPLFPQRAFFRPAGRSRIGAFDRRTIIELSSDVIKEIAQKYENVQKGVGDMMGGALIETVARKILNQGIDLTKKKTAIKLLKMGKLTIEEIAECSELSVTEVEQLAGLQTV